MVRFSIQIPDTLNAWLQQQANLNFRSKNQQIEFMLSSLYQSASRCVTGSGEMCAGRQHHFASADPATNEPCNCELFTYGEVMK